MFFVYLWQLYNLKQDLMMTSSTWFGFGLCFFLQHCLNTFELFDMALLCYCGTVSAFFSIQGSLMMFQRFRETQQILSRQTWKLSSRLRIFFHNNQTTFLYLISMNKVIGGAITLFLFAFCPLNTALITTVILHWNKLDPLIICGFIFFVMMMFLFSICIHMMTALFTSKFHAPSKKVMAMLPNLENDCSNRVRVHIACVVWSFPNKLSQCYGINYALISYTFGLISLATFAKVRKILK